MTNQPPDPETNAERTLGTALGELAPDDNILDALDRSTLEAMLSAGEEVLACATLLESRDSNVVAELLRSHDTIYEWTHYPEADVYDRTNHSQFYYPGFPRWLLPIAEKSNTIGIPKAIPTRSCHDRLGSALDRVCLAMRNSAP